MSENLNQDQDAQDMAELAAGNDQALGRLMDRYSQRLFHYLLRQLGNPEDADDLAQETFLRVYKHRARFDLSENFSTWLYTIATNLVRDRFRWRTRHPQVSLDNSPEDGRAFHDTLADHQPTPEEALHADERSELVRKAVQQLPEELRSPLILAEYEGLAQRDIAAVLNCTPKAVETRLYRARQRLRTQLQKRWSEIFK